MRPYNIPAAPADKALGSHLEIWVTPCWKVSARPSARLPLNSNLSVVPTGRPKALGRPRSLQCNKTVLLLVLLVKLQSYDVWKEGKIIAQT